MRALTHKHTPLHTQIHSNNDLLDTMGVQITCILTVYEKKLEKQTKHEQNTTSI